MIAKKVPMRSVERSDYNGLVKYLTDKQGKHQRLGGVSVSNCQSQEWQAAVIEVLNTQSMNTRAISDKTYHLIVSFRAGEEPDDATLKAIEDQICYELGYRDNQRVCVVHHDTDNFHFHIAINKIHPTRHTIHAPYYDHKTLAKLCQKLERQYGLEADNHQVLRSGSENHAADMERQAGVQSLLGWIQRECAEQMLQAKSWAELHALMAENGLQLQRRGNGLVITDGDGVGVKAGSVARELSKIHLEKRLGPFEQADRLESVMQAVQARLATPTREAGSAVADELAAVRHAAQLRLAQSPQVGNVGRRPPPRSQNILRNLSQLEAVATGGRRYRGQPMPSRYDTAKLYCSYKEEQQEARSVRAAERAKIAERRKSLTESAKQRAKLKRTATKAVKDNGAVKRFLYRAITKALQDEIRRIKRQCTADRLAIDRQYPWRPWADWLRAKAVKGDLEALAALRARDAAAGLKGNTLTGKGRRKHTPLAAELDGITKKGTIIYHVGSTAVRDDGERLQISRGANMEGLQAALSLAAELYGRCIAVNGTEAFKEQIVRAAAGGRLSITFDDAALEHRRKELLASGTFREEARGHDEQAGARTSGGRSGVDGGNDIRGTGGHGFAPAAIHSRRTARGALVEGGAAGYGKPDIGGVGREPPPQGQHRLRELSELGMVHFTRGGQVLLPRDVPDRLERQGAQPDHGVRRDIPRPGEMTAGQAAAEKYIAEREAMRLKTSDVPKHRPYAPTDASTAVFAGIRNVEGERLVLLERDGEIMVLPVGASAALRLKRVSIGETVTVTARGFVTGTRGRKL